MEEFKTNVLLTLTKIEEHQIVLKTLIRKLEERVVSLGKANSEAYSRTKHVINELAQHQEAVNDDLSDAMGTVRSVSWH